MMRMETSGRVLDNVLQGCTTPIQALSVPSVAEVRKINGVVVRNAYEDVFSNGDDFDWQLGDGEVLGSRDWMAGDSGENMVRPNQSLGGHLELVCPIPDVR